MADALINLWSKVTVYCMNHKEPVEMEIVQNMEKIKTPFYACKEYSTSQCSNRMNLDDYQGIVMKLSELMAADFSTNFTNYSFNYRGNRHKIKVTVLKCTDKEVRLGIKNLTILGA